MFQENNRIVKSFFVKNKGLQINMVTDGLSQEDMGTNFNNRNLND